MRRVTLIWLV